MQHCDQIETWIWQWFWIKGLVYWFEYLKAIQILPGPISIRIPRTNKIKKPIETSQHSTKQFNFTQKWIKQSITKFEEKEETNIT